GIGDFTDLAELARIAARHGASLVGLNPLHARHLARPREASPYSPSSRLFIDPLAIDIEAVPDFAQMGEARALARDPAFRAGIDAARDAPLVDHDAVSALKLAMLERLFTAFETHHASADDARHRDFDAFIARYGESLVRFAEFEALRRVRAAAGL